MMRGLLISAGMALLSLSCSKGVGRDPIYPDAQAIYPDAEPLDMGFIDEGVRDLGPQDVAIGVPDFGPPPWYPFTGVFKVYNSNVLIYAREVNNRLQLILGGHPEIYSGTIQDDGTVTLISPQLRRQGCPQASINGTFGRQDALFTLDYQNCDSSGMSQRETLDGVFQRDYLSHASGIYRLKITGLQDVMNCASDLMEKELTYAVSIREDQGMAIFTADDVISEAAAYVGTLNDTSFTLFHYDSVGGQNQGVAFTGNFSQASANEEPKLVGERDVFRAEGPLGPCTFKIFVEGHRVSIL